MAVAPSFSDILAQPTQDEVLNQEVLPEATKRNLRVNDWSPGGVWRTAAYVIALMRQNVRTTIASLMAAGFEDYAFGRATPPADSDGNVLDVTGWAPVIAQQRYGISQILSSYTRRNITLANSSLSPYGPLQPGPTLMIQLPSGNRYVLDGPAGGPTGPITIPANQSTFQASFRSEFPVNSASGLVYNDPSGSALQLVTSNFPGVTATNPAPTYSAVTQQGLGVGIPVPGGVPTGSHSVAIRIDTTGSAAGVNVGWSTNVDNTTWVPQTSAGVATNLGGVTGLNVTLVDNGGGSNAFIKGATYFYRTPGSDIFQVGADAETPQSLGARCQGQIATAAFAQDANGNWIATSPTLSAYSALAFQASSQIRVVYSATDTTINNKVNLIVAGQGGTPLDPSVVTLVSNFFSAFSMLTDFVNVQTSTARAITLAGLTVTTRSGHTAAAQAAMTLRLQSYLGGVDPLAPLGINGLVDYDYIIALVRTTAGVTKVSGTLTINSGASDLQLPVLAGSFEAATWSQSAATAFSWATATS